MHEISQDQCNKIREAADLLEVFQQFDCKHTHPQICTQEPCATGYNLVSFLRDLAKGSLMSELLNGLNAYEYADEIIVEWHKAENQIARMLRTHLKLTEEEYKVYRDKNILPEDFLDRHRDISVSQQNSKNSKYSSVTVVVFAEDAKEIQDRINDMLGRHLNGYYAVIVDAPPIINSVNKAH